MSPFGSGKRVSPSSPLVVRSCGGETTASEPDGATYSGRRPSFRIPLPGAVEFGDDDTTIGEFPAEVDAIRHPMVIRIVEFHLKRGRGKTKFDHAPKARTMAEEMERADNEMEEQGYELMDMSVTNSAKVILVLHH